ncbi:hypothetical protein ACEN2I_12065 [Flavobacterium sp. W22_SRS_FK3]|uniref:hypothetical protein n=1 Tax=Flavobacterium sp. W22_SRS_FK3 TaxID=3240275 RepID=UPI003F926ABB
MKDIVMPFHLVTPVIICLIGLSMIFFYYKTLKKNRLFLNSIIVFLGIYLLITGKATYDTIYSQCYLNHFDLNNDGMFTGDEITNNQKEAMRRLTNDTGRNLSFISGFIFSFFIAAFFFISGFVISKVKYNKV